MLTLKQLRDDKQLAIARLAKKGVDAAPIIAKIEELDDKRKAIQSELDNCLADYSQSLPHQQRTNNLLFRLALREYP